MSNKYHGRSTSVISRDTSYIESSNKEPSWFSDFVNNFEKEAVKSKKEDYSLFNQINSILGNKSKYSSVEEAVLDLQRRTGFLELIKQQKQAQLNTDNKYEKSQIFSEIPSLKIYIDNYVKDRPGTSVDAVVHSLLKITSIKDKLPQGDDVPEEVKHYINDKILESKSMHPNEESLELGKLDLSTDDNTATDNNPFGGCTPATK